MEKEIKDRNLVVYDIETLRNCFTYTDINVDTQEIHQFVLHESRNDLNEMKTYIQGISGMIGYNSISFDYPIIHAILTGECSTVQQIYDKAQYIISREGMDRYKVRIPQWKEIVPQLDLLLLNHFDNKAKMTSLKDIEFWMQYPNVQDMPIKHSDDIIESQIQMVLDYNLNDVKATEAFYKLCKPAIELRKLLHKNTGINCLNYNNGKIGEQLILKLYCEATGLDKSYVRQLRTHRSSIFLGDCIPKYAQFQLKEFKYIHEFFKNKTITKTKDAFSEDILHNNMLITYGTGGVHGCCKLGVYESNDEWIIKSHDVASLYPTLAVVGRFYPEHLGEQFCDVYENGIVKVRLTEKAKGKHGDKAIIDGYKEAANIPYGKSNDVNSFLYDPLYTLKTTISGMLALSMLTEQLTLAIPECKHLMLNTDGGELLIPRNKSDIYDKVCKDWEKTTGLILEFTEYDKIVLRDINNYIGIYSDSTKKPKHKGFFELDKLPYKDTSFKIVQIALSNYFFKNIPIEDTILNHKNIYDFCGREKFKSDSYGEIHYIKDFREVVERQQKTTRYYISNKGSTFIKVFPEKDKQNFINKGYLVTIFNKYVKKDDYDINYSFYKNECMKIIQSIEDKQLELF